MYFSQQFKRQTTSVGKYLYIFDTVYTQTQDTQNETPPFAVDGIDINPNKLLSAEEYFKAPDELQNPNIWKKIYTKWVEDCSGAFVKCPTVEQCLAKTESIIDSTASLASITSEEDDELWTLQWIPIRIVVNMPVFQIQWAPSYKILSKSRISLDELPESVDAVATKVATDVQNPEKTYMIVSSQRPRQYENDETEWVQEMADLHVPFADSTTLRLETDEVQKEKFRRKVRDARIRAKLARYRAERIALRYEERYGIYPEEDAEEAQTEVDTDHSIV